MFLQLEINTLHKQIKILNLQEEKIIITSKNQKSFTIYLTLYTFKIEDYDIRIQFKYVHFSEVLSDIKWRRQKKHIVQEK